MPDLASLGIGRASGLSQLARPLSYQDRIRRLAGWLCLSPTPRARLQRDIGPNGYGWAWWLCGTVPGEACLSSSVPSDVTDPEVALQIAERSFCPRIGR